MNSSIKILHIDKDYQIRYWIFWKGTQISSKITISRAIKLIKTIPIDLILSEPQNLAILNSPNKVEDTGLSDPRRSPERVFPSERKGMKNPHILVP
jgi:hypothetical protein